MRIFIRLSALVLALFPLRVALAAEGDLSFSVSPESAYSLLDETIRGAEKRIDLNIYMLTSRPINAALAAKAAAGVQVTILMEGEVFGGEMLLPVKNALDELNQAFAKTKGSSRFLVMTGNGDASKRRYVFNHAKYMLVDGKTAFVSSENITGSAFNSRNFTGGTRGWQIAVEDKNVVAGLARAFQADSSGADVVPYDQAQFKVKDPGNTPLPPRQPRTVNLFPVLRGRLDSASLCMSPKSLDCILTFIRSAKTSLDVQHMNLPRWWVNRSGGQHKENPIVNELVAAARRGVKVRVLLNDDDSFGDSGNSSGMKEERNDLTVAFLNGEASKYRIRLEAATFKHQAVQVNYVHNKGMISDGKRVFVSSINGTENSVQNNREVAVDVTSEQAGKYFTDVFSQDWEMSK